MSTSIATTKTEELHESKTSRYQLLVLKKAALEKSLNEKYDQLHQLCKKEASLIGNNLDISSPNTSVSNLSQPNQKTQLLIQQQRNKIHQNEINKLLIERQKQQQISQNSLSFINDPMQSKSLRRTHKQAYEVSQQKIEQLNENINLLTQKQRHEGGIVQSMMKSQDDIALHRSDNRYVKNALAMVGNNARNLHMLNANNSISTSERRNSMKSTTSSLGSTNTFIMQSSPSSATSLTSLKILPNNVMTHSPRTRVDSSGYNNNPHRYDFDIHKNESPTPSTMSLQQPQMHNNINHQIPLCSQSLKNIKINTENHSPNIQSYHHHSAQYSPQMQQQQFFVQNQLMYQHQQQQAQPQQHSSKQFVQQPPQMPPSRQQQQPHPQQPLPQQSDHNKFIHRLHSFNHQMQNDRNYLHMASTNTINHITDDVRMKHLARQQQAAQQASPNHYTVSHSAGLGGYWTINEHNNQRVWISENKFPLSPPNPNAQSSMAKKSNSLGNFDFMHQNDDSSIQPDAVSVSSGNSNELKKKEKIWCETSLDSPPEMRRGRAKVESPTPSCYSATDFINNNHVMNHAYENTPPSSKTLPPMRHPSTNVLMKPENGFYHNPLANVNFTNNNNNINISVDTQAPNLPPKSKLRYTESTRSTMSHRDFENNIVNSMTSPMQQQQQPLHSPVINNQVESPLNVTIIQEGSWKPYKEEVKSYEISDFYKYSEKYRQQQQQQKSNAN